MFYKTFILFYVFFVSKGNIMDFINPCHAE